jgi:hypothetical protein
MGNGQKGGMGQTTAQMKWIESCIQVGEEITPSNENTLELSPILYYRKNKEKAREMHKIYGSNSVF